jgi:hypothetical protein
VRTAYLNGVLREEIYMRQPEGFEVMGMEQLVCRLKKGLYGLKQAGRAWHQTIDPALQALGLTPLATDYCVYVHHGQQGEMLILGLYVDDLFLFTPSTALLDRFKAQLSQQFRMEDLGELSLMLGMRVVRDRAARTLTISQGSYVEKLLVRFNAPLNAVSTPMEHGLQLYAAPTEYKADAADVTRYQAVIGALMYAASGSRPDIAFAVHALGRFSSRPDDTHWAAVKHLLRYLRGRQTVASATRPPPPRERIRSLRATATRTTPAAWTIGSLSPATSSLWVEEPSAGHPGSSAPRHCPRWRLSSWR